jgi:protein ImuA
MLARAYGLAWLSRCLWIDPPDAGARLWAIDSALRCSGLVVIADGTGLDAAGSRRLQLAAEAGGTFGVLARPPREAAAASFAWSRWSVAWATPADHAASVGARWVLSLVRCKGLQRVHSHKWIIEGDERGGVVALSTEVADRRCASSAAS